MDWDAAEQRNGKGNLGLQFLYQRFSHHLTILSYRLFCSKCKRQLPYGNQRQNQKCWLLERCCVSFCLSLYRASWKNASIKTRQNDEYRTNCRKLFCMQQFCLFGILAGLQPALLIIIELSEKKVNVFRLSFLHDFYHKITFFSLKRTFLKVEKDYEKGSNRFIRLFRQCRIKIMWCCLSCTFIKGKLYAGRTQNDKNRSTVTQSDSGASGLI